jgi:glucose/arabinose dehydrogenase
VTALSTSKRPVGRSGLALACILGGLLATASPAAGSVPPGFQEQIVFSGLTEPTAVRFSADGRVFVAEKSGLVKLFDGVNDPTPDVFADLRTQVHNFWDRGLLGLELDPGFPASPYVYVLYAYDFDPAVPGDFPRWGTPGVTSDPCPNPPGATSDGCVITGRLSRLQASGNAMTGSEQVLIADWCQQYPSHSVGSLGFGADGALYATAGDGASFTFADHGQDGNPVNPCGDPPNEGGALRSQDRRTSADPTSLDGAIIRIDPATGNPMPDNPGAGDTNARRIIAHGFRNPFRFTIRPGTNEVWAGDVGWRKWEEIDRMSGPGAPVENYGWPCYEGTGRQLDFDAADLALCESLYAAGPGTVTAPYFSYQHDRDVAPEDPCPTGSSSISGLAFYEGGPYPAGYDGALFVADYSRDCIWAMRAGAGGLPDPSQVEPFVPGAANPVDLQIGPSGDLFYVDFTGGTVRRIRFLSGNQAPTAVASADPTTGSAPLTVQFDGTASSDPDPGDTLTYAWDLDGDGAFDDATTSQPTRTYTEGTYSARLRVTDLDGASDTSDPITITAGANAPPSVVIDVPAAGTTWQVGQTVSFSGHATDAEEDDLPPSALSWSLVLQHCPSNCHSHPIQSFPGVSGGSFSAPDHDYPSYLELSVTATDSGGLTDTETIRLDPKTKVLRFKSSPRGADVTVDGVAQTAPFQRTVILGSAHTITAAPTMIHRGRQYAFVAWSDGGARTHEIVAGATNAYSAIYQRA